MTFSLAFATADWALVGADARVTYPDHRLVDDAAAKVTRLPGGWCVGGTWNLLTNVLHDALARADLRRPDQVLGALADCQPTVARMLQAVDQLDPGGLLEGIGCERFSELAGGTAILLTVAAAGEGFACRVYDPVRAMLTSELRDAGLSTSPAGSDGAWIGQRMRKFGRAIARTRPTVAGAVRLAAGVFADVAARLGPDGAVSPSIGFGVLTRAADGTVQAGQFPLTPLTAIIGMGDADIAAALAPSPEPAGASPAPPMEFYRLTMTRDELLLLGAIAELGTDVVLVGLGPSSPGGDPAAARLALTRFFTALAAVPESGAVVHRLAVKLDPLLAAAKGTG